MADKETLISGWITFLKRAQIVDQKSDENGDLTYRKQVTVKDLKRYLNAFTHYNEEQIQYAIDSVISTEPGEPEDEEEPDLTKKLGTAKAQIGYSGGTGTPGAPPGGSPKPGSKPPPKSPKGMPGAPPKPTTVKKPNSKLTPVTLLDPNLPAPPPKVPRGSLNKTHDISDVEYKDIPNEPKNARNVPPPQSGKKSSTQPNSGKAAQGKISRRRFSKLREDIKETTINLDEKQVEAIFEVLASEDETSPGQAAMNDLRNYQRRRGLETDDDEDGDEEREKSPEERREEVDKIKHVIKTRMSESQIKQLWRLLTNA